MASETQVTDANEEKIKYLNACLDMVKNLRGMLACTVSHSIVHQKSFSRETVMVEKVSDLEGLLNRSINELIQ